jgi:hypothetical protein
LNTIFFTDDNDGYIAGYQKIYHTSNGGANWNEMSPYPTANGMKDIFISPDNVVMYGVGEHGSIIKNINSIGLETINEMIIPIFPNPSNGMIQIPLQGNYQVQVLDMKGMILKTIALNEVDKGKIDLHDLADGSYIIRVTGQKQSGYTKIIIHH